MQTVGAQSLLRLDPTQKDAVQTKKTIFSVESDTYDDTQYVKISSDTKEQQFTIQLMEAHQQRILLYIKEELL